MDIKLKPWNTPNFVMAEGTPGRRQDGFNLASDPKWHISDVDAKTLADQCDKFRADIFKKAGKSDPANANVSSSGDESECAPRDCYAIFHGEGGYPGERKQALRTFAIGKQYRVIGGRVGQSSTTLTFEGIPGSWNSVLFHYDESIAPIENPYHEHNASIERPVNPQKEG